MQVVVSGVEHALQTIQRYTDIDRKLLEIAKRLCEIGEPIIKAIHGNHATVTTEATKNGYRITASGEDVLFIEFGAGEQAGQEKGKYDDVPAVVEPGSWSKAHQGEYWRTGGPGKGHWHFAGQEINTVAPSPAFYYAYEYMVQNLPQIAKDVLEH